MITQQMFAKGERVKIAEIDTEVFDEDAQEAKRAFLNKVGTIVQCVEYKALHEAYAVDFGDAEQTVYWLFVPSELDCVDDE